MCGVWCVVYDVCGVLCGVVWVSCEAGRCCVSAELLLVHMDSLPHTCYDTKALPSAHRKVADGNSPLLLSGVVGGVVYDVCGVLCGVVWVSCEAGRCCVSAELLLVHMDSIPHTCYDTKALPSAHRKVADGNSPLLLSCVVGGVVYDVCGVWCGMWCGFGFV